MNNLNHYDVIKKMRFEHKQTREIVLELLDLFAQLLDKNLTKETKLFIRENIQILIQQYKDSLT